jgi:sterol desaturase/sphingolipid hydroxylase (fatty acid hydroxylase superfamily)
MLYWIHRIGHRWPKPIRNWHMDHHKQVTNNTIWFWHWSNLFLYNDTWKSTLDLWATEVIPTLLFSWVTGQWWISAFYYLWAAFIQEAIEHNPKFNIFPLLTSGKWHLIHHTQSNKNYGLFVPIWDMLFNTYEPLK